MSFGRFILYVLGWLFTIILQIAASYIIIVIITFIFAGLDTTTRSGWLVTLFFLWFGYITGVTLVGLAALRWAWKSAHLDPRRRLLGAAVGAIVPLLVLIPIGFSVPAGDFGAGINDLVGNTWQPALAQASVFCAVVGFYLPGIRNIATPIESRRA